jgi:O-antigen ligase
MRKLEKIVEYLFYLFLFLLPWQTRLIIKEGILNNGHWEWGTYSLYAVDIVFIILLVIFCLSRLIQSKLKITDKNLKLELLIIGFLLFVFLTVFWAKDSILAFYWALRVCQGVILFFLIKEINFSFIYAGFSLILAGLIQVFFALFQFINQKVFASKWLGIAFQDPTQLGVSVVETLEGRFLRVYGSLPHPNILAGFLVFLIFLSFILYLLVKKSLIKYFLLFSSSLITMILFLTFSRNAWLSLIITFVLVAIFILKKNSFNLSISFLKFFSLVLIVFLIFTLLFFNQVAERFKGKQRLEIRSINERILNFKIGKEIIKENFLFGVGIGNYTLALYQKYPDLKSWDYQPIANSYFLVLAELGFVGLVFFLSILYFSLSNSINNYWFLITCLLLVGLFDHWLFSLPFGIILFWSTVGLLWKINKKFFDIII